MEDKKAVAAEEVIGRGRWWSNLLNGESLAPRMLSVLRIVSALLFMLVGTMKLFAIPASLLPNGQTAKLWTEIGAAGVLESVGGILLLIGFFTRPVAFLLAGEMAVAYFQFHAPRGFWPMQNGGMNAVLYCFVWLYFSAAGAGPWSIDSLRKNRKSATAADSNRVPEPAHRNSERRENG